MTTSFLMYDSSKSHSLLLSEASLLSSIKTLPNSPRYRIKADGESTVVAKLPDSPIIHGCEDFMVTTS